MIRRRLAPLAIATAVSVSFLGAAPASAAPVSMVQTVTCGAKTVTLDGVGQSYRLKGACGKVVVDGTGVSVSMTSAKRLVVKGSNVTVKVARNATSVSLSGTGATVRVGGSVTGLSVKASRSKVVVKKRLGTARIAGSGVKLRAGATKTVTIKGSANDVRVTKLRKLTVVGASNYVKVSKGTTKAKVRGAGNTIKIRRAR